MKLFSVGNLECCKTVNTLIADTEDFKRKNIDLTHKNSDLCCDTCTIDIIWNFH